MSNDPLAAYNGNTAIGRRARDLYRIGAAEIGGRLSMRQNTVVMNWVRLQIAVEAGDVLLSTEARHAWRAIMAAKRAPKAREAEAPQADAPSYTECVSMVRAK